MHERIAQLARLGQSLWYDNIRRGMLVSGELQQLVDDGIVGVTSNPSILNKAITGSNDYDNALDDLIAAGHADDEVYETLVTDDIRAAADVLRAVYERTEGLDGYVSLEVSPALAADTQRTIEEAKRLFERVGRPNVMIKIPATDEGIPAIRATVASGINVNVTLIFSCDVYRNVCDAYLGGLEDLKLQGGDVRPVVSVASFFVSRVDTKVDKLLEQMSGIPEAERSALLGKAANANAKVAYSLFGDIFRQPRFKALSDAGARVQRPLWASTSTKNPAYPDTLYVDPLIGPDTVNTVPPATLEAFKDHGVAARTIDQDISEACRILSRLADFGIDLDQVTAQLRVEGVQAFADAFDDLMTNLRERIAVA